MAPKKESEGIVLLSMYNDEEEEEDLMVSDETANPFSLLQQPDVSYPSKELPQQHQMLNAKPPLEAQRARRKGFLGIVDYGHDDETAMSPEAAEDDGELIMTGGGRVELLTLLDGNLQEERSTPGRTVQILSPGGVQTTLPQSDNTSMMKIEETVAVSLDVQKDVDALEKFLPPQPKTKCSDELQEKINRFLAIKKAGKSFNAEVRNRKDYRNPDFLLHSVRYQDIEQIGSCFGKDVFDPHGYDKNDYYDEIEAGMNREMERKEQERKRSPKVDFVTGGAQPGLVAAVQKISMQLPAVAGVLTVPSSGLHSLPAATDSMARDSRLSKKSKWDKVDGDRKNPLHSGGKDTVSAAGTHASVLAGNVGAGYSAFAQKRRREAEEKRSSERRRT